MWNWKVQKSSRIRNPKLGVGGWADCPLWHTVSGSLVARIMRITSVALGRFPGICFMPVELATEHRAFLSSLHCGYVPDVKSICCTFMLPAPRSHIDVMPRTLLWLRSWLEHNLPVCSCVKIALWGFLPRWSSIYFADAQEASFHKCSRFVAFFQYIFLSLACDTLDKRASSCRLQWLIVSTNLTVSKLLPLVAGPSF